ncbi:hypothetical protein TNCV_4592931 [Trichonephila clavipes]|nr:hypothetical protein TNCV_4592931 [Trichonephila clavipes]
MLSSHPGAIYQQDNARPHTTRLSHVFNYMACQVNCLGRAVTDPEIMRRCKDYGRIFHRGQSHLIDAMPRRISACIAARGGFTTDF